MIKSYPTKPNNIKVILIVVFLALLFLPDLLKNFMHGLTGNIFKRSDPGTADIYGTDKTVKVDNVIVKKEDYPSVSVILNPSGTRLTHNYNSYRTDSEKIYESLNLNVIGKISLPYEDEARIIQILRRHILKSFTYLEKMYQSLYNRSLKHDLLQYLSKSDLKQLSHLKL